MWQRAVLVERLARGVNRRPRAWLTVFALLLAVQIGPWWYASRDGCLYLSLARNLARGGPVECLGAAVCVTPGYPLLMTPAFVFGDRPFAALAAMNWLLAVALLIGVYQWAQRHVPQAAVWVAGLTAVNAGVCYYYRRTLKEIAFMAAVVWAVNALHWVESSPGRAPRMRRAALGLGLVLLAVSIRYTGIALVAGLGAAVLLGVSRRRGGHSGGVTLVAVVGGLAVLLLAGLVALVGESYLDGFAKLWSDPLAQLAEGVRVRIGNLPRVIVPGMLKAYGRPQEWLDWNIALGLCLAAVVAWGWHRLAWQRRDVWAWSLPFYLGMYIIWPHHQGARFMVPMVPVLAACFWFALAHVRRVRATFLAVCFFAHLGGTFGYWLLIDAPRAAADHRLWATADQIAGAIDVGRGAVVTRRLPNNLEPMLVLSLDRP
ncbi:MAG TPA: hypothetical protein VML55_02325, partial [Planctomycetaceae bacterium]|nr:hypothetical protein [Planctomycetaceae bacterium]